MSGTKTATVRRPWDPLKYTLGQLAKHNIPIEQICLAVNREDRAAVKAYLAGEFPFKHCQIGSEILSIIQDIVDGVLIGAQLVDEPHPPCLNNFILSLHKWF